MVNVKTKKNDFASTLADYSEAERAVRERVSFAQHVIKDVLRKFPSGIRPEELDWVMDGGTFTGFKTDTVKSTLTGLSEPVLTFLVTKRDRWNGPLETRRVYIPMSILRSEDPIAVAQYARKLVRKNQQKIKADAIQQMQKMDKQIAELEANRTALREKLGKSGLREVVMVNPKTSSKLTA